MPSGTAGLKLVAAILKNGDLETFLLLGDLAHLFESYELPAYEFVQAHAQKHGTLPAAETLEQHVADVELPQVQEPPSYYLDHVRRRYVEHRVRDIVGAANEHMKTGPGKDPHKAYELLMARLPEVAVAEAGDKVMDFRDAYSPVLTAHAQAQMFADGTGVQLGWPTLDAMMGGAHAGDLISYVGRPQKGKTYQMLWSAHHVWNVQKKPVVFLTVEMNPLLIFRRLAAITAHVPASDLKLGHLSDFAKGKLKTRLAEIRKHDVPLYVVDGARTRTVPELAALCQYLKPAAVFVDGAYLMRSEDRGLSKFRRIDSVCDDLKGLLATECGVPTIASWQFNRSLGNTKKGETSDPLDHVYGSDTIAQNSSLVLGLFEDDTPETITEKVIEIVKGREGERGKFRTNWDFQNMDFSEKAPRKSIEPLEHVG